MKEFKIIISGASFETNNRGVSALAMGSVETILLSCPYSKLTFLDYGKMSKVYKVPINGGIDIPFIPIRFNKNIKLNNNIAHLIGKVLISRLFSRVIGKSLIERNRVLKVINDAHCFMALSGGDSFSDIYGLRRLIYVALPQILALMMKKPLILLPQTVGPFNSKLSIKLAKYILSNAVLVYTRDRESIKDIEKCIAAKATNDRFRFCYDVGFALTPRATKMIKDLEFSYIPRPLVGLNISGLLYTKKSNTHFGLNVNYSKLVEDIIHQLIRIKGASILLIPHVFGPDEDSESDVPVCKKIYEKLKELYPNKLFTIKCDYDQSEIKHIIGKCDFFIGSRMHSCIAAVSQSIPAVSISYSKKFLGVMGAVGIEECVADPKMLDSNQILSRINQAFDSRFELKQRIEMKLPEIKLKLINMVSEIKARTESY